MRGGPVSIFALIEGVHMHANGSFDCRVELAMAHLEALKRRVAEWSEPTSEYDAIVKKLAQKAIEEGDSYEPK